MKSLKLDNKSDLKVKETKTKNKNNNIEAWHEKLHLLAKGEQNFFPVSTSQSAISTLLEIWSNN